MLLVKLDVFKKIVVHSFYFLGIAPLFHYLARHKVTILYLHSIIDLDGDCSWKPLRDSTSLEDLDRSLAVLSQHYQFISLSDASEILKGKKKAIKNALVITLDDGYRNNITVAGPIFAKYGITPTLFVATSFVEPHKTFWFERLDYLLQQVAEEQLTVVINDSNFTFNCQCRKVLKKSYADFRVVVKNAFESDIAMNNYLEELACQLENDLGCSLNDIVDDPCGATVDWQDLQQLVKTGCFEIAAHTVNHFRLALVDEAVARHELQESQRKIEERLNINCRAFCYPDNSYNKQVIVETEKFYDVATTTDLGLNSVGENMMTLKRFNFPTKSDAKRLLFSISALRHFFKHG